MLYFSLNACRNAIRESNKSGKSKCPLAFSSNSISFTHKRHFLDVQDRFRLELHSCCLLFPKVVAVRLEFDLSTLELCIPDGGAEVGIPPRNRIAK